MNKIWVGGTSAKDRRLNLFVETSTAAIEQDLSQAPVGSLIHCVADVPPAEEPNRHHALALAALQHHARVRGFEQVTKIWETDSIPSGCERFWLGGFKEPQTCTVVVCEQVI